MYLILVHYNFIYFSYQMVLIKHFWISLLALNTTRKSLLLTHLALNILMLSRALKCILLHSDIPWVMDIYLDSCERLVYNLDESDTTILSHIYFCVSYYFHRTRYK